LKETKREHVDDLVKVKESFSFVSSGGKATRLSPVIFLGKRGGKKEVLPFYPPPNGKGGRNVSGPSSFIFSMAGHFRKG